VVSTQGQHLRPCPDTPVSQRNYDPRFIERLDLSLNRLLFVLKIRQCKYGDDAEEWPPSHTPIELKERWKAQTVNEGKILTPEDYDYPCDTKDSLIRDDILVPEKRKPIKYLAAGKTKRQR
jgi:hypothetical protein